MPKLVLVVLMFHFLSQQADNTSVAMHITTSDAVDIARTIARDEGYDVTKTSTYWFDALTTSDGKPFLQGYTSIGFNINSQPRNLISINEKTGQTIDPNTCEVFDYPDLRSFQNRILRLTGAKKKTAQELANEVGCGSPKVLTKPVSQQTAQVQHFVPTSELVRVGRMAARDEGYDPDAEGTYLDQLGIDGKYPVSGYSSIGLYRHGHLVSSFSIRIDTGDVVDAVACTIFCYPDLLNFKRNLMKGFGTKDVARDVIESEIGCDKLGVVPTAATTKKNRPRP